MMVPEYKAYYKNLGQNISFYRRRRDMSQEVLAEIVDVHNVHTVSYTHLRAHET